MESRVNTFLRGIIDVQKIFPQENLPNEETLKISPEMKSSIKGTTKYTSLLQWLNLVVYWPTRGSILPTD